MTNVVHHFVEFSFRLKWIPNPNQRAFPFPRYESFNVTTKDIELIFPSVEGMFPSFHYDFCHLTVLSISFPIIQALKNNANPPITIATASSGLVNIARRITSARSISIIGLSFFLSILLSSTPSSYRIFSSVYIQ